MCLISSQGSCVSAKTWSIPVRDVLQNAASAWNRTPLFPSILHKLVFNYHTVRVGYLYLTRCTGWSGQNAPAGCRFPPSLLNAIPNCMTAVIRAISELPTKLTFNDRFGCPRTAMCVCVSWFEVSLSELPTCAICWEKMISPLCVKTHGYQKKEGSARDVTLHKRKRERERYHLPYIKMSKVCLLWQVTSEAGQQHTIKTWVDDTHWDLWGCFIVKWCHLYLLQHVELMICLVSLCR